MAQVTIPKTIDEAKASLDGIGQLLKAKEWERAALVYAFTREGVQGEGGPGRQTGTSTSLLVGEFAALGITGLKSDRTVREYRKAWVEAMKDGAPDVKPGDSITVPTLPWPPGFIEQQRGNRATKDEVEAGVRKMIKEQPEKIVREIAQTNRKALVETASDMLAVGDEIADRTAEKRAALSPSRPAPTLNPERILHTVIDALDEFWTREVQAGPNRLTFQQVVETVIQNRQSPTLRSRVVPTVQLDDEVVDALTRHIAKSEDIRDGKTLPKTLVVPSLP